MADSKISALTDGGNLQGSDQVAINRGGTSYRAVALQDGWIDDTAETWAYASGSGGGTATFTIAGVDLTTKYTVGTRIKLTQTTVKYFVVTAVAFSTNTTVTITAGTDYTLANAAISANYHSYAANPQGYPGWFAFTPSPTGFTGAVTVSVARFNLIGRVLHLDLSFTGTSNATTLTLTMPMNAAVAGLGVCLTEDSGSWGAAEYALTASSSNLQFFKAVTNAFTNSGAKGVRAMIVLGV